MKTVVDPARTPSSRVRALRSTESGISVPTSLMIELIAAGLHSGGSIPRVLVAVGEAIETDVGTCLVRAGRSLLLGATWREAWEEAPAELRVLEEALVHAWEFGAPAAEALRSAREISEREALARAKAEAQRLGVRLVVPLGLCFLPSFILLAVVPLVAILAGAGL